MQTKALETVATDREGAGGDIGSLNGSDDDEERAERHQHGSESVFLYEISPLR